ncbi:MAG: hypothetical protein JJE01_08585 [Gemmatimonadetes bacterium]|nr:hypothetical protein [Gemmatimonadota bacterium]
MFIERRTLVPAFALVAVAVSPGVAQETVTYAHPGQPMSIEAPRDWTAGVWPSDPGVFEVSSPDGSVRALLWFTEYVQDAAGYLNKMVDMKPVDPTGEPVRTTMGGREAWLVEATGNEQGDEGVTETFAVIHAGCGSLGEGHFVLQVWCPSALAAELEPLTESTVSSLRVEDPAG